MALYPSEGWFREKYGEPMVLKKIVSGGQTGADQAGLIAGMKAGLSTGGFIPKGFLTEEGSNPSLSKYGLVETSTSSYVPRTYANAKLGDGTIRFATDFTTRGEIVTLDGITRYKKPYIDVDMNNPRPFGDVAAWIRDNKIEVLNVAGNRESVAPGIEAFAVEYLGKVIETLKGMIDTE